MKIYTLDELVELKKSRIFGAKDLKKRKRRGVKSDVYEKIRAGMKEREDDILKQIKAASKQGTLWHSTGLQPMGHYLAKERLEKQGRIKFVPPKGKKSGGYII